MFQRALLTIPIAIFICLAVSSGAQGCACSQSPAGTCQGLQKGDVVFLGTVTGIEIVPPAAPTVAPAADATATSATAPNEAPASGATPESSGTGQTEESTPAAPSLPVTRYRFHIDDKFSGPEASEIDVLSGGDDGDCGYRFKKGDQYIVFTQQELEGKLFATVCNGTRPSSEGRALLPQLRAMRNGMQVASVFGVLRRADPPFLAPPDDPDDPLPNTSLHLRSRDDRFSTSTGPDGVYSFYHVHAGEYRFTAQLPARMVFTQKTLTGGLPPFKIPDDACYEYNVDALPTGHIRGTVFGPDRKPLKLASVELYRSGQYAAARPGLWGFQGSKGYFDFDHIGPGEYVIVYNRMNRKDPNSPFPRAFYPGVAEPDPAESIVLKDGQQLLKANIKLVGGYPTHALRVRVKWEQGRPPGNLTVMAKAQDDTANPGAQKISDDLFQFPLFESGLYAVSAWEDLDPQRAAGHGPSCTIPARIDAGPLSVDASDSSVKEITLTFAALECAKQ